MRINVHGRVDKIFACIPQSWHVLDMGAGDGYSESLNRHVLTVDREPPADILCDFNQHYPDVQDDIEVAVISGVLEWVMFPAELLTWALAKFPRVFFSYANIKSDPNWRYLISVPEILNIISRFGYELKTEPWQGQTLFFVTRPGYES